MKALKVTDILPFVFVVTIHSTEEASSIGLVYARVLPATHPNG